MLRMGWLCEYVLIIQESEFYVKNRLFSEAAFAPNPISPTSPGSLMARTPKKRAISLEEVAQLLSKSSKISMSEGMFIIEVIDSRNH
jgi:hypothetical protein